MAEDPRWTVDPEPQHGLFSGLASNYAAHRPRYPAALLDEVLAVAEVDESSVVLDLACGTGEIARLVAGRCGWVHAVDLEPEMVTVGLREARAGGKSNIAWRVGAAERLSLEELRADLVTVGNAFHRLDRRTLVTRLRSLREPPRIAVLGSSSLWSGDAVWQGPVRTLVRGLAAGASVDRLTSAAPETRDEDVSHDVVLREGGFDVLARSVVRVEHTWSLDAFLGYVNSLSIMSGSTDDPDTQQCLRSGVRDCLLDSGCDPESFVEDVEFSSVVVGPDGPPRPRRSADEWVPSWS